MGLGAEVEAAEAGEGLVTMPRMLMPAAPAACGGVVGSLGGLRGCVTGAGLGLGPFGLCRNSAMAP